MNDDQIDNKESHQIEKEHDEGSKIFLPEEKKEDERLEEKNKQSSKRLELILDLDTSAFKTPNEFYTQEKSKLVEASDYFDTTFKATDGVFSEIQEETAPKSIDWELNPDEKSLVAVENQIVEAVESAAAPEHQEIIDYNYRMEKSDSRDVSTMPISESARSIDKTELRVISPGQMDVDSVDEMTQLANSVKLKKFIEKFANSTGSESYRILTMLMVKHSEFSDEKYPMELFLSVKNPSCNFNRFTDTEIEHILNSTVKFNYFKKIDLRFNNLTGNCIQAICKAIGTPSSVEELDLTGNDFDDAAIIQLADSIKTNSTLKVIRLAWNKFSYKAATYLSKVCEKHPSLMKIDLEACDLDVISVVSFLHQLRNNRVLTELNLSRPIINGLYNEHAIYINYFISNNQAVKALHICNMKLKDEDTENIFGPLQANSTLRLLNVSENKFSMLTAQSLFDLMGKHFYLTILDLSHNLINSAGAKLIAQGLCANKSSLRVLNLKFNRIDSLGLCCMADTMKLNTTLKYLFIWGNKFDERSAMAYEELHEKGRINDDTCDIRPYRVNGVCRVASIDNDCLYRNYNWLISPKTYIDFDEIE